MQPFPSRISAIVDAVGADDDDDDDVDDDDEDDDDDDDDDDDYDIDDDDDTDDDDADDDGGDMNDDYNNDDDDAYGAPVGDTPPQVLKIVSEPVLQHRRGCLDQGCPESSTTPPEATAQAIMAPAAPL